MSGRNENVSTKGLEKTALHRIRAHGVPYSFELTFFFRKKFSRPTFLFRLVLPTSTPVITTTTQRLVGIEALSMTRAGQFVR